MIMFFQGIIDWLLSMFLVLDIAFSCKVKI
jgi:hypothetical protein